MERFVRPVEPVARDENLIAGQVAPNALDAHNVRQEFLFVIPANVDKLVLFEQNTVDLQRFQVRVTFLYYTMFGF